MPTARKNLQKAIAAGVKIALGTDAAVFPHGDNAKELTVYVKLGMSPADAIRTATVNAADLLGIDDRGTIEEGKLADLIAVRGNPLEDITVLEDVKFVMHGGRIVKKKSRSFRTYLSSPYTRFYLDPKAGSAQSVNVSASTSPFVSGSNR